MAHDSLAEPCMWGSRLAVPSGWPGRATVDDVRALVDGVHRRIGVHFPMDDFFLNVLGTSDAGEPLVRGRLRGKQPRSPA